MDQIQRHCRETLRCAGAGNGGEKRADPRDTNTNSATDVAGPISCWLIGNPHTRQFAGSGWPKAMRLRWKTAPAHRPFDKDVIRSWFDARFGTPIHIYPRNFPRFDRRQIEVIIDAFEGDYRPAVCCPSEWRHRAGPCPQQIFAPYLLAAETRGAFGDRDLIWQGHSRLYDAQGFFLESCCKRAPVFSASADDKQRWDTYLRWAAAAGPATQDRSSWSYKTSWTNASIQGGRSDEPDC